MGGREKKKRATRTVPEWMLVRDGSIQNIMLDAFGDGRMRRCIPLFSSYDHARSFIGEEYWAKGARPCKIGSLRSESNDVKEDLSTVIAGASLLDHCEYAALMEGNTADGGIRWRLIDIRPETLRPSAGPGLS